MFNDCAKCNAVDRVVLVTPLSIFDKVEYSISAIKANSLMPNPLLSRILRKWPPNALQYSWLRW